MSYKLVVKDAAWQLAGRVISALAWFLVIKIMSPYLWPLRYGDYSTILKYFAIWSALADFGLYVIAVKRLGSLKEMWNITGLRDMYGKFMGTRYVSMITVYVIALVIAYFLPAYTSNPYLMYGLPIGMLFSATFMGAGMNQIPLQLFWKMEQLSIGLVLARIVQLAFLVLLVFGLFPRMTFDGSQQSIWVFVGIISTVLASGITQWIYVAWQSQRTLSLCLRFDWSFTRGLISENWKYWLAYYLSSFHTLIVLLLLSNFFPTVDGYSYTGIWALALALIEIFLIIPSSLGNSLLHKVSNYSIVQKCRSFGHLISINVIVGLFIAANFVLFSGFIIRIIWGADYIGESLFVNPGANHILPFLGIVLLLSFIKQVYNYLFVSVEKQNVLFTINIVGVTIWLVVALYLIPRYAIVWGIVTQVFLEILFVLGAAYVAWRNRLSPIIPWHLLAIPFVLIAGSTVFALLFYSPWDLWWWWFVLYAAIFNIVLLWAAYFPVKKIARGLTDE